MFNKSHNKNKLYNTLLTLSRNIYFYKNIKLPDTFETRIYLMFIHFSIFMIVAKKKNKKFDQKSYDYLFHNIEYNLREQGFGDVSVNKKMKEFNKILYDILLKLDLEKNSDKFKINSNLILNYFECLNTNENSKLRDFIGYFSNFFNFCFELPLDNMIEKALNYKF
jgi:cytochrome b pre-mRNA-processing protein 3